MRSLLRTLVIPVLGVAVVLSSAGAATSSSMKKPPDILWKAKGTQCVVTKWNETTEEPELIKAVTKWEMWFDSYETQGEELRLKARMGPAGVGTWALSVPWGKETAVKYPNAGQHWTLRAATTARGFGFDWDVGANLHWERQSPYFDWTLHKRFRFNEATCPQKKTVSGWSGTVSVVTDVDYQGMPAPSGQTLALSRHDEAVYTLSAKTTPTMKGEGNGRAVNSNPVCVAAIDPFWRWSYAGEASVAISYSNGRFSIRPRGVDGTVQNTYLDPSCIKGPNEPFAMVVPPNIEQTNPVATQQAPATATTLKGQQSFPWLRSAEDTKGGTMTVSWDLKR